MSKEPIIRRDITVHVQPISKQPPELRAVTLVATAMGKHAVAHQTSVEGYMTGATVSSAEEAVVSVAAHENGNDAVLLIILTPSGGWRLVQTIEYENIVRFKQIDSGNIWELQGENT